MNLDQTEMPTADSSENAPVLSNDETESLAADDFVTKPLFSDGTRTCFACENDLTDKTKLCYACRHGLTGETRDDGEEEWECWCTEWECRCRKCRMAYCPICESHFATSDYLSTVFTDDKTLWLANMVTHYRHEHRAWDRTHPYISKRYGQETYEHQKSIINEQAKRQIIRKSRDFLLEHGIGIEQFVALKGTDERTLALAVQRLQATKPMSDLQEVLSRAHAKSGTRGKK